MTSDPQLGLFEPRPQVAPSANWLERLLLERRGWVTAREILTHAGREDNDAARRLLRVQANKSDQILSGQRGYRHLAHATPEEIHHAAAWWESQAGEMQRRAIALRRRAHQFVG